MHLTRTQSRIIAIMLLAVFFFVGIYFAQNNESTTPVSSATNVSEPIATATPDAAVTPASVILTTFKRSEIRNGKKIWEVEAVQGNYYPEAGRADLTSAHLEFQRADGSMVIVDAERAIIHFSGTVLGSADLSGDVRVNYANQIYIQTEAATYDQAADRVTSSERVWIRNDSMETIGTGLRAELSSQNFYLAHDVETVMKPRVTKEAQP